MVWRRAVRLLGVSASFSEDAWTENSPPAVPMSSTFCADSHFTAFIWSSTSVNFSASSAADPMVMFSKSLDFEPHTVCGCAGVPAKNSRSSKKATDPG